RERSGGARRGTSGQPARRARAGSGGAAARARPRGVDSSLVGELRLPHERLATIYGDLFLAERAQSCAALHGRTGAHGLAEIWLTKPDRVHGDAASERRMPRVSQTTKRPCFQDFSNSEGTLCTH